MAHGFTVQGGLGAGGSNILHESSAHSVLVPDTELLFTAQFHRAGPDLVLTGRDGQHHLIPGYFSSEHHPALVAPNGAHLSPDTVDLLAGSATPGHYAQAQPTAPPDAIGKIEKVVGDVTVVRNGATVALHVGDAVFKSDVVQAGASSSCGISFPDGTVLNLVANTRMALNDYAYDANSNANGALFTLVEGTFAFVAGKVAHSGDMKIATPVATMGIRGTTGVVQEQPDTAATITANAGGHTYTFAVVPDIGTGVTGMWDVFLTDANGIIQRDANGNPIVLVTVSQSGYVTYLTPQGLGQPPLVSTEPATNSQYAFEQEMLQQLFRTLNPANLNGNGNNGSSSPPPPFELPNPIPQLFEDSGKPFTINVPNGSSTPTPTIVDIVVGTGPLTVVIWVAGGNGPWSSGPSWLGGAPPTSPQEVEILNPVKVTTDGADSAAGLVINAGAILNIVSGTSFTIYDFIHGGGTIALNSSGSDPTLFIHGGVTLAGGGTIKMLGPSGEDNILGVPGTGAVLVNVDYTIEGTGTIGGGDGNLTFQNFGIVNADNGCLIVDTGNQVYNDGLMEATADPLAATTGTLQIKDSVVNAGTVQADGAGTAVKLSGATFDNLFWVVAKNGGSITFTNVAVTNEAVSATDPAGGTINAAGGTITFNGGSIANGNLLEATDGGILQLENLTVTNSAAGELSIVGASSELDLMNAKVLGGLIENCGKVVVTAGSSILHGDTVTNSGTMTVEAGASLTLEGDTTLINERHALIEADGDHAKVIIDIDTDENVNSGTIKAINGGEVDFNINIDGGSNHGLIEACAGGTVHFFQTNNSGGGGGGSGSGDHGGNYGTMEAADGGVLIFDGGLDNFCRVEAIYGGTVDLNKGIKNHAGTVEAIGSDSVTAVTTAITVNGDVINDAKIEATGFGAQINISNSDSSENAGTIIAENHGTITLSSVQLENDHCATVEANGATIDYTGGTITNDGTFKSDHQGAIFIGSNTIVHNDGTGVFEALSNGFITFSNSTVYNGVSVSGTSGGTIEASCDGSITFADSTVYNGSSVPGSPGGIIQASCGGTVTFSLSCTIYNNNDVGGPGGVIEALRGGTVDIDTSTVFNNNGTIEAIGCGAVVNLFGTDVYGGTLASSDGGVIEATFARSTLQDVTILGGSVLDAADGLGGSFGLSDTTTLAGGGTVTFEGAGEFLLGGDIVASTTGTTLKNASTIDGSGQIGAGDSKLTLDNESGGTIDANEPGFALTIHTDNTVTNAGTLEATHGGTLEIDDKVCNTACGVISASGHDSVVQIDGVTVIGGTLETSKGGVIDTTGTSTLSNVTIADGSTLEAGTGATFLLEGTTTVSDPVTFKGCGTFELSGKGAAIVESGDDADLHNYATISGAGTIGSVDLSLTNECGGVIDATGGLTINLSSNDLTNDGTMEATCGGELTLLSPVINYGVIAAYAGSPVYIGLEVSNEAIGQVSGEVIASGHCAVVDLSNATIIGGTVASDKGGLIQTVTGADDTPTTSALEDVTIGCGSDIKVVDQTTLILESGTTMSGGRLSIESSGGVEISNGGGSGGATLTDVTLHNCGEVTVDSDTTLTLSGTTVHGGAIDGADASGCVIASTIDVTGDSAFCDVKLSHGDLTVEGGFTLTLDGGTICDVAIENGTVTSCGVTAGTVDVTCDTTFSNTVLHDGNLTVESGVTLSVEGDATTTTFDGVHVTDSGTIQVDEPLPTTTLLLENATTISGGGALSIGGTGILDVEGGATLDGLTVNVCSGGIIEVGETTSGSILALDGTSVSGCGAMTIKAGGTLDVDSGTTTINLGGTITNHGTLEASCGGTLDIVSHVDNACGALLATSGGLLDVQSCISGGTATIHGATLEFDAASNVNVTFDNDSVDAPTYGTLVLGDPADFCGTIANFTGTCPDASHSDTIDLADFKACNTTLHATYNCDDGITTLCVVDKADDLSATLKLIGQYSTGNFTIASDGKGGIDIFDPPTTGATDAPATATAAPGNDHVATSAHQNGLDPAASPANAAGFGGDQDSAADTTAQDGATAPPANQLALAGDTIAALPSATSALGGHDLAGFGDDPATVPAPSGVNGGAVTMQLTAVASPIPVVASGTPALDGEHLTDSTFVDGSDIAKSEVTPSTVPTAPTNNEHTVASALATPPAPAASPTLASASFGGLSNDSFAFHPNLGSETAQTTDAHASDLAHSNLQIASPALAAIVPEFHQEFAFDAIHQDAAVVAAAVDQFHQMAANTTLLH